MLQAKNKQGKLCSLIQVSRTDSEKWRNQAFFCPICSQRVQLKNGRIRIPHFAHLSEMGCSSDSAGESQEHLTLKKAFAECCLQRQIAYQLEAYIPQIKQRADLLIGKAALEIQCSTLPLADMLKRTTAYIENGFQPIWICGERIWQSGKNTATLRKFCSYSERLGFYIWTADWRKKQLYLRYHIELKEGKLCYGSKCWDFGAAALDALLERRFEAHLFHSREYSFKRELTANYQMIYRKLRGRKRDILAVQSFYYQNGLHLLSLHLWFYYPINQEFLLNGSDLIFKYRFWTWLASRKGRAILESELLDFAHNYFIDEKLSQLFPLIEPMVLVRWLLHYLIDSLLYCRVLRKTMEEGSFEVVIAHEDTLRPHTTLLLDEKRTSQVIITGTPLKI